MVEVFSFSFAEMSGGGCSSIVWFRRDLRIEDNPALTAGVRAGAVVAVFVWAPEEEGQYYPGRVSRWWLKNSLAHLDSSLRNLGTPLITKRSTDTLSSLLEVVKSTGATQLFFNHLYGKFSLPYYYFQYFICHFLFPMIKNSTFFQKKISTLQIGCPDFEKFIA